MFNANEISQNPFYEEKSNRAQKFHCLAKLVSENELLTNYLKQKVLLDLLGELPPLAI